MDLVGVVGLQLKRVSGDGGDRTGQPHQCRNPLEVNDVSNPVYGSLDVGGGCCDLCGCRRVTEEVPLGHPNAPDINRHRLVHLVGASHELSGAAPDVHHEIRAGDGFCLQVAGGPTEGQGGFFVSGDDLGCDAEPVECLTDTSHELLRVGRIARRRGRDEPHPLDAELRTLRGVFARLSQSANHRLR